MLDPTRAARGDHRSILAAAQAWRGADMALATVVSAWGSAPRPVGSHLLMAGDGRFAGSVSGGCVEAEIMHAGAAVIAGAPAALKRFGVTQANAWDAGLPCGGDIAVLVQPVAARGFDPALFDAIAARTEQGAEQLVATDLDQGRSECTDRARDDRFMNRYAPPRRMLIVGAVDIAQSLAVIAQAVGFAVTVIDPRARFLTAERFPGIALNDDWPDAAVEALRPDASTAVVTLSHDPKIDDPALISALAADTGYIGALGSRRSHAARLERLAALGLPPATLARVNGPAGVAIDAVGPAEIALSIAGGAVAALHRVAAAAG